MQWPRPEALSCHDIKIPDSRANLVELQGIDRLTLGLGNREPQISNEIGFKRLNIGGSRDKINPPRVQILPGSKWNDSLHCGEAICFLSVVRIDEDDWNSHRDTGLCAMQCRRNNQRSLVSITPQQRHGGRFVIV